MTGLAILLAALGGWEFHSAPLAARAAVGTEEDGVHVMRLADRGSCGWWFAREKVMPETGARFRARVAIEGGEAYNDLMMFVKWLKPEGGFYQRDFIAYTDRTEGGRTIRCFDETYAVPEKCAEVEIEFIGKWHAMTARIETASVERVERPKARKVRCVVGNPHESTGTQMLAEMKRRQGAVSVDDVFAVRLGQIEATLTNIFAKVENPDIILFSECLSGKGASNPSEAAEAIPGGPSWRLAERYAVKYNCNIALDVKERDENGQCHNTVFVCDRKGKLAGRYRKVHLTSGEYQEGLVPGDGFPVFNLDFGRVGALVCWDNWFAESMKLVKRNGAELLLFPLAGCAEDHVDTTFPARAIDAGIPILVAMRQGHLPNGIIDRDGKWIAKTFEDNGFAVADLDLSERKRTFWLSVGPGMGDPYELYYDESRPEIYEKFNWCKPRR